VWSSTACNMGRSDDRVSLLLGEGWRGRKCDVLLNLGKSHF
jgi:hypothetical protein